MDHNDDYNVVAQRRVNTTLRHLNADEITSQQAIELTPCSNNSNDLKKKMVQFESNYFSLVQNQLLDSSYRGHHQGKEPFKWNGWGYDDTEFKLNAQGEVFLSGKRYWLRYNFDAIKIYNIFSGVSFPKLRTWAEQSLGLDIEHKSPANKNMQEIPDPIKNTAFLQEIENNYVKISFEGTPFFFITFFRKG